MSTRMERRVVVKTADYTINPTLDRPGTVFTNRGATGPVVFTLPQPGQGTKGWWYKFRGFADFPITVKTAIPDTLVVTNDLQADSLSIQTASAQIGAEMEAFCDGVAWAASGVTIGASFTIAT